MRGVQPGRGRAAGARGAHALPGRALAAQPRGARRPARAWSWRRSAGLFPEGGWEPYPLYSFLATLAAIAGYLWAMPAQRRLEWIGGVVYLAACVACVAVHSPVGANVERYGVLLAGPLLLCALLGGGCAAGRRRACAARLRVRVAPPRGDGGGAVRHRRVDGVGAGARNGGGGGQRLDEPLLLRAGGALRGGVEAPPGPPVRVEVPFTRGHWEAAWLAPRVSLARGWEKQLDERYDGVLLAKDLTAARYRAWLKQEAVSYVALPDAPLDPSSAAEGRLIEAGLPYLHEVERTRHWRIYASARRHPARAGTGHAQRPGPRLVRAAGARGGELHGEGALHPLLDGHAGRGVRGPGAGGLDGGDRAARGRREGRGELLDRPRAGAGRAVVPGGLTRHAPRWTDYPTIPPVNPQSIGTRS